MARPLRSFGVEVGGFLGHYVAGEGDVFELVEGDWFDEEGDVGPTGLDEGDGFVGLADEVDVAETGDGVLIEAEELVEDDGVELDYVQLGLAGGNGRLNF